jgi:hypothetical protein
MNKKILYKLNVTRRFLSACFCAFDSDTPFPSIHPNDELLIRSELHKVTGIRHQISKGKDTIDWITIVAATEMKK